MINNIINLLWLVFQVLIGYNLVLPLLMVVFSVFVRDRIGKTLIKQMPDYAIIVTAYEQTDYLQQVVKSLLDLNYHNYMIYIVADNCPLASLIFDADRVVVLRPPQTLASNIKSHDYAIKHFIRKHDIITIIDSDNLVHPEYINELNKYFDQGFEAVQGLRAAKNLNSTYACLDAARDLYYHFYDGELLFKLGSSATLAGSGMAFKAGLYQDAIAAMDFHGAGFDKVVQAGILLSGKRIAFAKNAIVYDEKTVNPTQLVNQRARWINTWFRFCGYGLSIIGKGIKNRSLNQLLFGVILLRPPLFIFLILSLLLLMISILTGSVASVYWILAIFSFLISFLIALLRQPTDARIYRSLAGIPKFIYYQVVSLVYARGANKRSVATKHIIHP
ncbi:glycosyltransferase [Pedobacter psychrodurus]|uniref:Glycosyltransferase n=1 Tax=Pedobacter psychrodurus TaxID=2530456 RepID=A0A4R0PXA4_9SPHI|nr:glycosyltransferase [Pedobacter psychrodurus]TCD23409.1 glycosyltransferase [Pedobacter psychrodurus]